MSDELHILRHSLGLKDDCAGREYRNYYAVEPDDPECLALVAKGDMERSACEIPGGLVYYRVTAQGRRRAYEGVVLPTQTRSQKRYKQFLEADSGMTFKQWLTTRSEK